MAARGRILRGVSPVALAQEVNLPLFLINKMRENKTKPLLIDAENEERFLTYGDTLASTERLAAALQARGIGPSSAIAICSENSIEFPTVVFAAFFVGSACSPLSYSYTPRELQHALGLTRPRVIFISSSTEASVLEALESSTWARSAPPLLVRMPDSDGDDGEEEEGLTTLTKFISSVPQPVNFKPYKSQDPTNTVALVMCSSGTTGLPKGVQLTQANVYHGVAVTMHPQYDVEHKSTAIPGHLPFFHVFGFLCVLAAIAKDYSIVVLPFFSPQTLLRIIQDHKVVTLPVVPPLMQLLATSDIVKDYDLSSLKHVGCGAAPLSGDLQDAVTKRLGIPDIRQGYGLTEGTSATLMVPNGKNKLGTSGCVVPGMEAKIIGEDGKLMGPNERGELCFRGPLIMKGYICDPRATSEAIDTDGWLHTGDVAYYDNDECLFIVDRLKELIKYKAFQVPPAELEAILLTMPGVEDAAVVGLPDPEAGELPLAFVVRKDPNLSEQQVKDYVARQVSHQKRLRGGVRFIDSIPKNPSGKILRRELRPLLKSKL